MFDTENVGPPVKPPRKYQVLEMSQSLGNEIKVEPPPPHQGDFFFFAFLDELDHLEAEKKY